MKLANYLVLGRKTFYFRLKVPTHIRPLVGRCVIKRSLYTLDPMRAQSCALWMASRYIQAFAEIARGGEMAGKTLEELLAGAQGKRTDYEITPTAHGGFAVKAEGLEDHKMALEALTLIQSHTTPAYAPQTLLQASVGAPVGIKPMKLGEARDGWLLREEAIKRREKTYIAKKKAIDDFVGWVKKSTVTYSITKTDLGRYCDVLLRDVAKNTANYKLNYIAGFFKWAMACGYYGKGENPAQGHIQITRKDKVISASKGWQAFKPEQLKTIFEAGNFSELKSQSDRWLPILALYTGARSNEIALLELEDFTVFDETYCVDFSLLGRDKSLKTEATNRTIPIHPNLIALGLWKRVEKLRDAGETKLFPLLSFTAKNGPANAPQRAFIRYLARRGIKARGEAKTGLHSFRDTLITKLEQAGIAQGWRERYVGHEQSEKLNTLETEHKRSYGSRETVQVLAELIFPKLDWAKSAIDIDKLQSLLD